MRTTFAGGAGARFRLSFAHTCARLRSAPRTWTVGLWAALGMAALVGSAQAAAIFVMKVDGSEVRKVAQVEGYGGHGSPRFSHDDQRIVFDASSGGNNNSRVFVVNFDGSGLRQIGAHAMPDLSPDDKQVAYHNYGGQGQAGVYVQNMDGQGRVFLTEGGSPRWSPDGSQIAFTDWRTVKLLDLVQGEPRVLVDEPFEEYQIGFDWSPDGKRVAFRGKRNNLHELWIADTDGASPKARVRLTADIGSHVAWAPDNKRLAISLDDKIQILDVDDNNPPQPIPGQEGGSGDVAWSHDGKWIAFASSRAAPGRRQVAGKSQWKLQGLPRVGGGGAAAYSVAFTSDGQRAVLGNHTGKTPFEVWDFQTNSSRHYTSGAVFLALSPNDRTLATTGLDLKIDIVDLDSGDKERTITIAGIVTALSFSKDGKRLLSPTLNRRVPVWNVETGKTICAFNKHEGYVMRAVFSPDGKEAMSGGHDKKLRVWDSTTAVQRLEIDHPEVICAVAVTPDGRFALTGTGGELPKNALAMTMTRGTDNVLRMWDLSNGKLVRDMKGHSHAIFAIDVSPDGRFAVSGGWDGWIRVWDLQSGDEVAQSQGESSVMDVKFSPDGRRILVGGGNNRFAGEEVRWFPNERARLYQLVEEDADEDNK